MQQAIAHTAQSVPNAVGLEVYLSVPVPVGKTIMQCFESGLVEKSLSKYLSELLKISGPDSEQITLVASVSVPMATFLGLLSSPGAQVTALDEADDDAEEDEMAISISSDDEDPEPQSKKRKFTPPDS